MPDIPDDIHDTLRAMLARIRRQDAARKAADTRVRRRTAAYEAGLIRKVTQDAKRARWAPKAPKAVERGFDLASVGVIRFDLERNRHAIDSHGRWWRIERDKAGWHAFGPETLLPGGTRLVPELHRATSAEIRAKLRAMPSDLKSYMRMR